VTAALNDVARDPQFDAIRWNDAVLDSAHLSESENGTHLTLATRFDGEARLRGQAGVFDTWRPVTIECEQIDEGEPHVHIRLMTH
jgi:hypothetical protein